MTLLRSMWFFREVCIGDLEIVFGVKFLFLVCSREY